MGAVFQGVSQLCHAHQLGNDGPRGKLGQVGFDQGHVHLDFGALVQYGEESLNESEKMVEQHMRISTKCCIPFER